MGTTQKSTSPLLRRLRATNQRSPESPSPTQPSAHVHVLGVGITNVRVADAAALLANMIQDSHRRTRTVYFANAHTLNLAWKDPAYRDVLNRAGYVFADGTGVRWAALLQGVHLLGNITGTDVVPLLFSLLAGHGYRYFLLGASPDTISRSAASAQVLFPDWDLVGFHHGYLDGMVTTKVIDLINDQRADMLLVGMGNPLQETWLDQSRDRLNVPLCLGIGGLFEYWAGNLDRAPAWMRRIGMEWAHILWRQPHKFKRYVLGNPLFLTRILRDRFES